MGRTGGVNGSAIAAHSHSSPRHPQPLTALHDRSPHPGFASLQVPPTPPPAVSNRPKPHPRPRTPTRPPTRWKALNDPFSALNAPNDPFSALKYPNGPFIAPKYLKDPLGTLKYPKDPLRTLKYLNDPFSAHAATTEQSGAAPPGERLSPTRHNAAHPPAKSTQTVLKEPAKALLTGPRRPHPGSCPHDTKLSTACAEVDLRRGRGWDTGTGDAPLGGRGLEKIRNKE
ncbi:hypothetical protein GCM10022247_56260 [Allokutzneria multivorans]|uniref:Uncharacterized protein n=1 Tax=Allokutzneria multivorans TaxID=1142134 RepID=A0ABP7TD68_9PSEU